MLSKSQVLDSLLASKGRTKTRRRPITREEAIAAAFVSGCRPGLSAPCRRRRAKKKFAKCNRPIIPQETEVHYDPVR